MNDRLSQPNEASEPVASPIKGLGAVVLAGGKSTRLGRSKAELPFRGSTMLDWVTKTVSSAAQTTVVVGNVDLEKHQFPPGVICLKDEQVGFGPLEGIRVGLKRLDGQCELAFVASCDAPLLKPELIRFLHRSYLQQLDMFSGDSRDQPRAIVPVAGNRIYGMTAIYQTSLHGLVATRIEDGLLRVSDLAAACFAHLVDVESLKVVDPELDSLTNINQWEDYENLLQRG